MFRDALVLTSLVTLTHQSAIPRAANNDNLAPLKFNTNGSFQIAIFNDLHFGQYESSTGPEQDLMTVKVIGDVLDYEPPDLVVLNGDLINGDSTYEGNSTHYVDQIVAPIIERNLTWASTYGNHDHDLYIDGDGILEREQMWPGSRTQKMVNTKKAGTPNYYLPVYPADCTDDSSDCTPELLLWFFDSRGGRYSDGDDRENWVDQSVVTWFNETNTELVTKYDKVIPSLTFVHIPVNATMVLQTELTVDPNYQPGINLDPAVAQQGAGWCEDGTYDADNCHYGSQDYPFMTALTTIPGIIGLFFGHDHGNTWCYKWDEQLPGMSIKGNGINMCYGQHGGYGGYGDWVRGGREIIVTQEKLKDLVVDTHIRLETGDIVGAVTLNSTYNNDWYSATPNTKTYMNIGAMGDVDTGSSPASSLRPNSFAALLVLIGYLCL